MRAVALVVAPLLLFGDFRPPAGERFPVRGPNGAAILPGGQALQPLGTQLPTAPGPVNLAVTLNGRFIVTANTGPERTSVTILERTAKQSWSVGNLFTSQIPRRDTDFQSVSGGIAAVGERLAWIAEGGSGRVRLIDLGSGAWKRSIDINGPVNGGPSTQGSYSGALAFDARKNLLYVADPAHSRIVMLDAAKNAVIGSAPAAFPPVALSLAPDGNRLWATGRVSDPSNPDSPLAQSFDVSAPQAPQSVALIPRAGAGSAVLATRDAVYIAETRDDAILVIDPATVAIKAVIPLRVPGLEALRGIFPSGMACDETRHWLLVTAAGINAVAVIDTRRNAFIALLPTGRRPESIDFRDGVAIVANEKGSGTGPSSVLVQSDSADFGGVLHRGSLSRFELPAEADLPRHSRLVLAANGFLPAEDRSWPDVPIHHIAIIVNGGRTFDEVLGDLKVENGAVAGMPRYARFGESGSAYGGKRRFSLQGVPITPNQHALARQFAFSDNFYAGENLEADGYPSPGAPPQTIRRHLESNGVSFLDFGAPGDLPDQTTAEQFIGIIDSQYLPPPKALPGLILIHLSNGVHAEPRASDSFPYQASYVADNDLAIGKIVEFLSHTPWWPETAVFVTGENVQTGIDHVEAERTVLLAAGPYVRKKFVSHVNAGLPAIWKTAFHYLHVPPLDLFDAAAADLRDMLTPEPTPEPFTAIPPDGRLFDASPRRTQTPVN